MSRMPRNSARSSRASALSSTTSTDTSSKTSRSAGPREAIPERIAGASDVGVRIGSSTTNLAPSPSPSLSAITWPRGARPGAGRSRARARCRRTARARTVGLPERLEHVRQELLREPAAGVVHAHQRARRRSLQADGHRAAHLGELHRVRQQVPDHLLQATSVTDELDRVVAALDAGARRPCCSNDGRTTSIASRPRQRGSGSASRSSACR